jgi:hypothetical protein
MVGYPTGSEDVIVRGDPADDRFTVVYVRDEAIRAVLMVNDDAHFDTWTQLVRAKRPAGASLGDPGTEPYLAAS